MSDLLPTIIPPEDINEANDPEPVSINEDVNEEIEETIKEDEEELPPKPSVPQEEVFKGDDETETEVPKKKPKRKITEAQREHLAKARAKANEVRKRKAQERKLLKQQEARQIQKAKKEVAAKIKSKNKEAPQQVLHNPMESEEEDEPSPPKIDPPIPHAQVHKYKPLSIDDVDEDLLVKLSEMAVEKYDNKRKKRKEEKHKKIKETKAETETHQQILNAINPPMNDVWDSCFQ